MNQLAWRDGGGGVPHEVAVLPERAGGVRGGEAVEGVCGEVELVVAFTSLGGQLVNEVSAHVVVLDPHEGGLHGTAVHCHTHSVTVLDSSY